MTFTQQESENSSGWEYKVCGPVSSFNFGIKENGRFWWKAYFGPSKRVGLVICSLYLDGLWLAVSLSLPPLSYLDLELSRSVWPEIRVSVTLLVCLTVSWLWTPRCRFFFWFVNIIKCSEYRQTNQKCFKFVLELLIMSCDRVEQC